MEKQENKLIEKQYAGMRVAFPTLLEAFAIAGFLFLHANLTDTYCIEKHDLRAIPTYNIIIIITSITSYIKVT